MTVRSKKRPSSMECEARMNICKVWDAEYPWDVRVEKIAFALTRGGHSVHLVARNRHNRQVTEELEEATVHRVRWNRFLGKRLNAMAMFPAFFNPRWIRLINRTVTRTRSDLILCRDLPLAPSAIWVGRRHHIPVVLDMAENYPAMIRDIWESDRRRPTDWVVRNPGVVKLVERYAIRRVDHILVVVEESRDRLVSLGVPPERISIVSNTPSRERLLANRTRREASSPGVGESLHVVYLGILEVPRGLGVLLEAVSLCRREGLPVRLSIIGSGRDRTLFDAMARGLSLDQDSVTFHGYLPNQDALRILESADVGVVPHFATESCNTTIPNKLFDYMAYGLPVVTSDARPLARIVRETGCGIVFRDRNGPELAMALRTLMDPAVRRACGDAGRNAIATHYNWERDSAVLLAAVERSAGRAK